jgi:MFS family permease
VKRFPRVLRDHDFRYLFLGQSASAIGDQAVIVALALYVTRTTGSATDLGFVLAAQTIPLVALVLFGGVLADRFVRARVMLVSDLARAAVHAAVAALILCGGASVAELIVAEALFGAARAFFQPAYAGLLPHTVAPARLQEAQALSATTANLAILVGPALGTALVLTVGAGPAFAFDAATFAVSAALLLRVRVRVRVSPGAIDGDGAPVPVLRSLREGWLEVRARPWFAATIGAFTLVMLCGYAPWNALAPSVARDVYGAASRYGVLESVTGGGALLGAIVGMRWRPRRPLLIGLLLMLIWPFQTVAFALGAPFAGVIALAFAAGVGFALFNVFWETGLATHIPPEALSRVSAYDWMGSLALLPLGFALSGPLAAALGPRRVLVGGALIGGLALVAALLPRSTRSLPGPPAAGTASMVPPAEPEGARVAADSPRPFVSPH